jgi:Fur family transcriptional regulator, ferric uptake regulator
LDEKGMSMADNPIKQSGLKSTKSRLSIWAYFNQTPGKHHTAEAVYLHFSSNQSSISLSTIYRVLNDFERNGLLIRHRFESDFSVYELVQDDEHHDHLVCRQCKKVVEFYNQMIESQQEKIASGYGFALEDHRLVLFGVCKACRAI